MLLRDAPPARAATEARIEVLPDEPIGRIRPDLYGHFTEHIGGVVYDGIWVGEDSRVPNIEGIRKELVEHMRRLGPGALVLTPVEREAGTIQVLLNWTSLLE